MQHLKALSAAAVLAAAGAITITSSPTAFAAGGVETGHRHVLAAGPGEGYVEAIVETGIGILRFGGVGPLQRDPGPVGRRVVHL